MTALLAFGVLAVGVLLWSERTASRLRAPAKIAASVGFVFLALTNGATASGFGRWVLAALLLSAVGDVALLGTSSRSFLTGLGAFLVAHLAYIGAFVVRGVDQGAAMVALGVLAVPAAGVIRWLWPHVPPPMRIPVTVYASVITMMVAAAAGTATSQAAGTIVVAATAFYLSDLAVARQRFVAPGFANKLWGLPLYYCAQYLFASIL